MGGAFTPHMERRGVYRVLVEKFEGRRSLGRTRHRWDDNIKMDLQDVEWGHGLDPSGSGWGQVAGSCECGNNLHIPYSVGNFLTSQKPFSFSRRTLLQVINK